MQNHKQSALAAAVLLYSSLAFGLPLAIQSSPTFSSNLSLEHVIGIAIIAFGVVATQAFISASAQALGRRVSYYRIVPLFYWPLGPLFAIFILLESTKDPKQKINTQRNLFVGAFAGKEPLLIAFWGVFAPLNLLSGALLASASKLEYVAANSSALIGAWAIHAVIVVYSSFALWRCAPNTDEVVWKWLARLCVTLVWLPSMFPLVFHRG